MAALGSFLACKRDMPLKDKTASPSGTALIKLIDVSPNLMTVLPSPSDSFHVLFNGVKVTGYTSGAAPAMAFNATYPFAGTQNGYASVPAGDQEIKFAKGLNTLDSLVLFTFHETLAANQYYSLIITDSIKSARDSSRIFLQDVFAPLSAGFFGVRFVNAAWNDTANVDIWSTRNNRTIFGNIKPGVATAFSIQGYNSVLSDTLFVRRAGTLVGLDTLVTVSFSNMRSYTLVYKGNALSNKTSDTKRRHLINYLNQ
jgi:hypothetical protein